MFVYNKEFLYICIDSSEVVLGCFLMTRDDTFN